MDKIRSFLPATIATRKLLQQQVFFPLRIGLKSIFIYQTFFYLD